MKWTACFFALSFVGSAVAQVCPGEDPEPALSVKLTEGPGLALCGFEDNEVVSPTGKRTFTDFTIYYTTTDSKTPRKIFTPEVAETYWVSPTTNGLLLEEVWFFVEQPKPALRREIKCAGDKCELGKIECVFDLTPKLFPDSLEKFDKKKAEGELEEEGEDLLDEIWAEALTGDAKAREFYAGTQTGLDSNLAEIFASNKKKLSELLTVHCPGK